MQCTNFELATHVPLIISSPTQAKRNTTSKSPVELLDIFPTLIELTGLPQAPQLEGTSLAPILDDPAHAAAKDFAMSQFARTEVCTKRKTKLEESPMGYTIRTTEFRYTEWVKFNYTFADPHPLWTEIYGKELYAHSGDDESSMDDFENENLAGKPEYAATVQAMHDKLHSIVSG